MFRNNASPQQYAGSYYGSNRKGRGQQRSPSSAIFFNSNSISPTLSSSPPRFGRSDNNYSGQRAAQPINITNTLIQQQQFQYQPYISSNYHHHHMQQHRSSPGGSNASATSSSASSPPNITLFAGSKCYDAPAPTALPRPPRHWTSSCGIMAAKKSTDEYSHNLKLLLNVQA